ncbi:MAG: hypothetical protein ACREH8_10370, partial [Opitutaceae bacterium]
SLRDAEIFPYIPWAEAHGYGRTSLRESQCTRGDLCRKVWRPACGRRGVPPPRLDLMGKMPMPLRSG